MERNLAAGKLPGIYDVDGAEVISVSKDAPSIFYLPLKDALPARIALFDFPAGDVDLEGSYKDEGATYNAIRYHIRAEHNDGSTLPACTDPGNFDECAVTVSVSNDESFYIISVVNPKKTVRIVFYATDKNGAEVEFGRWVFQADQIDTDDNTHGPNGEACKNSGVQVDVTKGVNETYIGAFDESFTCNCSATAFEGANCETQTFPDDICEDGTFYQTFEESRKATCTLKCPGDVINALFVGDIETKDLQKLTQDLGGTKIDYAAVSQDLVKDYTQGRQQCGEVYYDASKEKWIADENSPAATLAGSVGAAVALAAATAFAFALA